MNFSNDFKYNFRFGILSRMPGHSECKHENERNEVNLFLEFVPSSVIYGSVDRGIHQADQPFGGLFPVVFFMHEREAFDSNLFCHYGILK